MQAFLWQQGEFLLRILLAGVCGAMIGYERKSRNKEAGIRTHMIVAMGAALIMIVSKYGFGDLLGKEGVALDPSRIAAQIVTGVGFLGAGMIFIIKKYHFRTYDCSWHMGNQCYRYGDWKWLISIGNPNRFCNLVNSNYVAFQS